MRNIVKISSSKHTRLHRYSAFRIPKSAFERAALVAACGLLLLAAATLVHSQQLPAPFARQVVLETSFGSIVMELYPDAAPNHVKKFLERVEKNFYAGTTF
ncbi:MAG TPA: peptidylprolyl isomerase, partial [Acidobacteriota bacterium]